MCSPYVKHLFESVNAVSNKYYDAMVYKPNLSDLYSLYQRTQNDYKLYNLFSITEIFKEEYQGYNQSRERNFCYELYYEWKKFIVKNDQGIYNDLILNGEIRKDNILLTLYDLRGTFENLMGDPFFNFIYDQYISLRKYQDDPKYFEPDLTLHRDYGNFEDQRLIVEVKTHLSKREILKDFYKLLIYDSLFLFKEIAMVVVKVPIDELKKTFLSFYELKDLASKPVYIIVREERKTTLTTVSKILSGENPIDTLNVVE